MQYIIANWKMNGSMKMIGDFSASYENDKSHNSIQNITPVICPPFPYLSDMRKALSESSVIKLGAQNCHHQKYGAFTGEISSEMLTDLGCEYVILGHSERRSTNSSNETNHAIREKAFAAIRNNITPIICISERGQIIPSMPSEISENDNLIIAYEPITAIGTGILPSIEEISSEIIEIKRTIREKFELHVPILYGGSVNKFNCKEIINIECVDGLLIGGASLIFGDFFEILHLCDHQ